MTMNINYCIAPSDEKSIMCNGFIFFSYSHMERFMLFHLVAILIDFQMNLMAKDRIPHGPMRSLQVP